MILLYINFSKYIIIILSNIYNNIYIILQLQQLLTNFQFNKTIFKKNEFYTINIIFYI